MSVACTIKTLQPSTANHRRQSVTCGLAPPSSAFIYLSGDQRAHAAVGVSVAGDWRRAESKFTAHVCVYVHWTDISMHGLSIMSSVKYTTCFLLEKVVLWRGGRVSGRVLWLRQTPRSNFESGGIGTGQCRIL